MAEPGRKIAVFEGAMAAAAAASDERMQQPWLMGEAVAAEKSPVLKLQESREMADDFRDSGKRAGQSCDGHLTF